MKEQHIFYLVIVFTLLFYLYVFSVVIKKIKKIQYFKNNGELVEVQLEDIDCRKYGGKTNSYRSSFKMIYEYKGRKVTKYVEDCREADAYKLANNYDKRFITIDKYDKDNIFYGNALERSMSGEYIGLGVLVLHFLIFMFIFPHLIMAK